MDNFLLVAVSSILALYFFSSMNIYKSMYRRIAEEKNMAKKNVDALEKMIRKYEAQIQNSIATIDDSQSSLQLSRDDLQRIKIEKNELEHRNQLLQSRVNELYDSVGSL